MLVGSSPPAADTGGRLIAMQVEAVL